ncbi:MAG: ATPase [Polyangiaceae bacterium]
MARRSTKKVASASSSSSTTIRSSKAAVPSPQDSPSPAQLGERPLSAAREAALTKRVQELPDEELIQFPGRFAARVQWTLGIWASATRDADDLSRAPFFDEPHVSREEIADWRDEIALLRLAQSRFLLLRGNQKVASAAFEPLAVEAAQHKDTLLRAFTLRFRNDPAGLSRVTFIRKGTGDADLVQDVSDLLGLCAGNEAYLARGTNGEATAAKRLAEMEPRLLSLLGEKTRDEGTRAIRRFRDGAFTLVTRTERRIRAAAEYCFGGTPRMKDYIAYVAPKGAKPDPEDDVSDATPSTDTASPAAPTNK